ncbi:MAG: bifunctional riboflavin kinase/FAD synthetase [Myxococcales bacterium]|nr:bifunctional riboflavin kinase/FAD synthetase [Myxococcales bacterium]
MALLSIDSIAENVAHLHGCVLTIGNFDGVHRGHQTILAKLAKEASERRTSSVALTLEPHPVRHFRPDGPPFRLTTPGQKISLLRQYGVEAPIALQFDESTASILPERFVSEILLAAFEPQYVLVGYDFNYGKDRRGDPALLEAICQARGVDVFVQTAVQDDSTVISSTAVRKALRDADMAGANVLLGRPFAVVGTVEEGEGRGRVLGFPTANLAVENELIPSSGVYATWLEVEGAARPWRAITNIGVRPTFDGEGTTVETFVLEQGLNEHQLDLYGKRVALHFTSYIRPEMRFPGPDALISQINNDIAVCRELHSAGLPSEWVPQADWAQY